MRFLVLALLLAGLLSVPSATAVPNCLDDPNMVDCNVEYVQGRTNYFVDRVQDAYNELRCPPTQPPFCLP